MKRRLLYGLLGGVIVGVAYWAVNSEAGFRYFSRAVTEQLRSSDVVWFRSARIDSLYNRKHYTYFWFMRQGCEGRMSTETASLKKEEVLVIVSEKEDTCKLPDGMDVIRIPESAFDGISGEGQVAILCRVDSVMKGEANRYRVVKYKIGN